MFVVAMMLGSLALPGPSGGAEGGTPPNILLLIADDLGVDGLESYGEGSGTPTTPNIDSLAQGGLLFRNVWSNPVCSTTRATILTGNYAFRNGIGWLVYESSAGPPLQLSELTLPEALDWTTGGLYAHAAFGKWHLGDSTVGGESAPNQAGFSHYSGALANLLPPNDYFNWPKTVDGTTTTSTNYATTETVDDVLAWVGQTPEPWFAHVAFHAPHTPFHSPPANLHTVDLTQPTKRLQFEAMVEALDTEIGRLLASLPPAVSANTMVIFVGDNGSHSSITLSPFDTEHAKSTLYEGGVNVPLIISGPLLSDTGEVRGLVTTTDLYRTVLEMAGGTIPLPAKAGQDSVSLVPYFADASLQTLREYAYAEEFLPNGVKQRNPWFPIGSALPQYTCQDDLGFAGPGTSAMRICGEPLYGGYMDSDQNAQLLLTGAPPNGLGMLFQSFTADPMPMYGGTLVPNPATMKSISTDALGVYMEEITAHQHILGPRYYQAAIRDVTLPGGFAISNCVAADTLPSDLEAIRDLRFKLIVDNKLGREEFFDLALDPFEQLDLLAGGSLEPFQANRLTQLRAQLIQLRWNSQVPTNSDSNN